MTEIQLAVPQWYPTWPVAGRLATLATTTGVDLDATLPDWPAPTWPLSS